MKINRILTLATLFTILSTAFTANSMERTKPDTTLKIYTAETISHIKKARDVFEIECSEKPRFNWSDNKWYFFTNAYHKTTHLRATLEQYADLHGRFNTNLYDYSPLGAVIISKVATFKEKQELLFLMENFSGSPRFSATEKDHDLNVLELYERRQATCKNQICCFITAYLTQKGPFAELLNFPFDVIKLISQYIVDTEKSLFASPLLMVKKITHEFDGLFSL